MLGQQEGAQDQLFYSFKLEAHIPSDHLLRGIDRFLDLDDLRKHLAPFYSHTGRPSIDPELMIRMLIIRYSFGIRRLWPDYWTEEERAEFAAFIATTPDAGEVIRGPGGFRKVRWTRPGSGKSGGVRAIYVARLVSSAVVLLTIYGKGARETIPANVLREIARELGRAK